MSLHLFYRLLIALSIYYFIDSFITKFVRMSWFFIIEIYGGDKSVYDDDVYNVHKIVDVTIIY